ncbi:MAG: amidohydrolase family protein [Chloroflexi bacterium]|nr:amidohydrolase family protein [Chloroflexota bacterium]
MRSYNCVSADSHVQILAEQYAPYVPKQYRDRLPKLVKLPNGGDGTLHEDGTVIYGGTAHFCGHAPEEFDPTILRHDQEAGHGSPEHRLHEQDVDGVDAEILFSFGGGRGHDREMAIAVAGAYNTYLAEAFCSVAPDRLLGIGILANRGVEEDISEMEHCLKLGLRGVLLGMYPSGERYPTPDDDRFWAAAVDLNMPVTVHTSMSIRQGVRGQFMIKYPIEPEGYDRPPICLVDRMSRYGTRHCGCLELTQMIMTGVFDRFPTLKIYWAENQIGWIPIFMEQMDMIYEANHLWAQRLLGLKPLAGRPSEYVREHAYWGFFDDPIGVRLRGDIGVDHIMWGSDFPHEVSRWPHSQELLNQQLAGVHEEEKRKMLAENVARFFHLDR